MIKSSLAAPGKRPPLSGELSPESSTWNTGLSAHLSDLEESHHKMLARVEECHLSVQKAIQKRAQASELKTSEQELLLGLNARLKSLQEDLEEEMLTHQMAYESLLERFFVPWKRIFGLTLALFLGFFLAWAFHLTSLK